MDMSKAPHENTHKLFRAWLKAQPKVLRDTFGRSQGGYVRGLRTMLTLVEAAYSAASRGEDPSDH